MRLHEIFFQSHKSCVTDEDYLERAYLIEMKVSLLSIGNQHWYLTVLS
jgi:hypothetical protein